MLHNLTDEIRKTGARKVMVQLPAGLKTKTIEISKMLESNGIRTVFVNNPCYGACDTADEEAKVAGCDLLVHVGHSKFYVDFKTAVPVLYFPWFVDIKLDNVDFSAIKEKRIGLLTTIQHLTVLNEVKEKLEKTGKHAEIGGQVLGCWFANAEKIADKVDAFLYVGSGKFHPLGYKGKKIYALDIETQTIEEVDPAFIEKKRWANIYKAKDARTFAILVTTKKGQNQLLGKAEELRGKIESSGREAVIMIMNEINDNALLGIRADAFVNTACPRIVEDHFSKPIINASDVSEVLA